MDKWTRDWLTDASAKFPSVRRSLQRYYSALAIIEAARLEVNGPAYLRATPDLRRGRPSIMDWANLQAHTRERRRDEVMDKLTHREEHQTTHVIQCPLCCSRKTAYMKNHPEIKGAGEGRWWETAGGATVALTGKPHEDWAVLLDRQHGALDATLADLKRYEPKRLMQGTWPLTDDEDPE